MADEKEICGLCGAPGSPMTHGTLRCSKNLKERAERAEETFFQRGLEEAAKICDRMADEALGPDASKVTNKKALRASILVEARDAILNHIPEG